MSAEDLHAPVLPGGGASDYERYLRTDELLALQKTEEERVHHDELLFQTVHQSSELWLKFATTEVDKAAAHLEQDEAPPAIRLLRRAVLAMQYVTTQMEMLNQMDPWEYQQIRVVLARPVPAARLHRQVGPDRLHPLQLAGGGRPARRGAERPGVIRRPRRGSRRACPG